MGHDCGMHGHEQNKLFKRIYSTLLISLLIILIVILLIWAILHPTKPQFTIQDATLYNFNLTTNPTLLTSTIQLTLTSQNPNDKIGIYYSHLDVYATYNSQQITIPSRLPSDYQGHKEVCIWSPFIYGNQVPIAPYNALELAQDQKLEMVDLVIKMDGRVRFKVGSFVTGTYHLDVRCPVSITFGSRSTGVQVGEAVKYQLVQRCSVSL